MFTSFVVLVGMAALVMAAGLALQSVGPSEYRRRLGGYLSFMNTSFQFSTTATTSSSITMTAVGALDSVRVGMHVTGPGVPTDTTVVAVSGTVPSVTLSQATTSAVTAGNFVFGYYPGTGTANVHLYAAPYSGGSDPTPADFTEATFDTYAALPAGGTQVYSTPDGTAEADIGDLAWVLIATPAVGNTIYGYWIDYPDPTDPATIVVSTWEDFPTPILMTANGNAVVFSVPMTMPLPSAAVMP